MGGTILVSKGNGFATSTVDYDYFAERIRAELMSKHPTVLTAAYEPLDDGGMMFISLEALDGESYRIFVEATKQAALKAATDASFSTRSALWRQLHDMLQRDARLRGSR
ncbi:hypothetical protein CR105_06830 [Massilia eurypsychrophila]|jgi:hypothetical protein|uniref:Uncharacterized protein n=1 Tax=Massilia eurypsychrophila TaxID=1485217 RepID=A0A2G8TIC0_9BURK|nr:hypothetical protein [Massilia eurypsychrophila]PIL45773.1 hypothetical protein CR105_06830 [Massilia eurypsychrophila]